jgi:hypothetical protein
MATATPASAAALGGRDRIDQQHRPVVDPMRRVLADDSPLYGRRGRAGSEDAVSGLRSEQDRAVSRKASTRYDNRRASRNAEAEKVRAEGWKWTTVVIDIPWNDLAGLVEIDA